MTVPGFKISENADYLNFVCNAPEVRAGGSQDIDVSILLNNGIAYEFDGGSIIYVKKDDGIYEAHTQALKSGRGKVLREFIKKSLDDLFLNFGANVVTSYANKKNVKAQRLAMEFLNYVKEDREYFYYQICREEYLCQ